MIRQCVPVVDRNVFHTVRVQTLHLMGFHTTLPALPFVKPFAMLPATANHAHCLTPMRKVGDWSLVVFLPPKQSFFITSKGSLLYNWNFKVKECEGTCPVWSGTVLGVEKTDFDWFAADAFVVCGKPLLHLPLAQRKVELATLKRTCMPELKFVEDLQNPQGSRVWRDDSPLI